MENRITERIKQIIDVLYRNIRVIIISFVVAIVASTLITLNTKTVYEARTILQIEPKNQSQIAGFDSLSFGMEQGNTDLDQQERIYLSRSVIGDVKEDLSLNVSVENLQKRIKRVRTSTRRSFGMSAGGLLEFSYTNTDPELVVKVLEKTNEKFIEKNIRRYSEEARNSINFLNESISRIELSLAESASKLNDFKESSIPYDISLETQTKIGVLVNIEDEISKLDIKEEELSQSYKPNHPIYQTLINQRKVLEERKVALNQEIGELPSTEREFVELSRNVEINNKTLENMLNRKLELSVIEASTIGNIRIIDEPFLLISPVAPRPFRNLVFFFALAFIFIVLYLVSKEVFFKKILSPKELESANTKTSAVIPNYLNKDTTFKEAFRTFVTNILLSEGETKKILITGPTPGVGKSFTAFHLSDTLAGMGKKVLLLDLDLRRGDLHEIFGVDKSNGFSNKQPEINKINENLDFVARGSKILTPFTIIGSKELKEFIESQTPNYDHIIFDTAPLLSVSDASILSEYADKKYLVVRQNITTINELNFTLSTYETNNNTFDGLVLNDFTASSGYYGYDYYSYKYAGNYDYD